MPDACLEFFGALQLIRTFETRLDLREGDGSSLSSVLNDYAALMSRAERLLLAKLKAGRVWTGDLKVSFYQHLGISATHLDMAYRQFQAKLKSVSELAKDRSHDSTGSIDSKRADIRQKQMALTKAKATGSKLLVERMTATPICSCACHVRWRTRQALLQVRRAACRLYRLRRSLFQSWQPRH